jgi:hypothetical protein
LLFGPPHRHPNLGAALASCLLCYGFFNALRRSTRLAYW